MTPKPTPNFKTLRIIQIAAVLDGLTVFALALYLMGQFSQPELAPIVIAVALAGITFGAVFYFGCLLFEPSLQAYIAGDRTEISGERVEMVTDTRSSGDPEIDEWVNRYVFARNLLGMSVIPLLLLGALYIWA